MSALLATNEAQSEQCCTYLLLDNPKPNNNLGPLLRCASAFLISHVVMIGYLKCNTEGAHGAHKHLLITSTTTWDHAIRDLRDCYHEAIQVVGIIGSINSFQEVEFAGGSSKCADKTTMYKSFPVHTKPFSNSAVAYCFLLIDHKDENVSCSLLEQCDLLVHVPQLVHGFKACANHRDSSLASSPIFGGMNSLVETPARVSIVMHHFNAWIGRQERTFHGNKFDVAKLLSGGITESKQLKVKSARLEARKKNEENAECLFDDGGDNEGSWGLSIFEGSE
uniref:Uncharacterized protein n=1 Tax=Leptocylindrus danicus TaxID=163516 RepID=A0A7S2KK48_9STRA|mmetsp:Transcript_22973/g.34474  ORF Transcript_22973/g.34474 Transcript_22973/m.34474 type:complete len:279 (+) Transcript_22973:390-1226(+)